MGKRVHKYGCRRDNWPIGDLGRMEDFQYNKLLEEKGTDTHLKKAVDRSKIKRLTEEEYKAYRLETDRLRLQAGANRKRKRGIKDGGE